MEMIAPRMLPPVEASFSDGMSVWKTAGTFALGFAIGMFPLIGVTTIVCVLLAHDVEPFKRIYVGLQGTGSNSAI